MIKKIALITTAFAGALLLAGCAHPIPNVPLNTSFWHQKGKTVGVNIAHPETTGFYKLGQVGLLDDGIDNLMTSDSRNYVEKLAFDPFNKVQYTFVDGLNKRGMKAHVIKAKIDITKLKESGAKDPKTEAVLDFRPLAGLASANYLLIMNVTEAGIARKYYGVIPLGDPVAIFNVEGRLVNLTTNAILWRDQVHELAPIGSNWDSPPHFTALKQAYMRALTSARSDLLLDFFNQMPSTQGKNS